MTDTPEFKEIMRLWRIIQRLTRWKGSMNDKEEAVFGRVYTEFKRLPSVVPTNTLNELEIVAVKMQLATLAAGYMRALYELEKQ